MTLSLSVEVHFFQFTFHIFLGQDQAVSLEAITTTLRKGKHPRPKQVASSILQELHRPQLQASEITVRTKSRLMLSLTKQLVVVIEDIARYDKEIQALFLTHPDQPLWSSLLNKTTNPRRVAPDLLPTAFNSLGRRVKCSSNSSDVHVRFIPFPSCVFVPLPHTTPSHSHNGMLLYR